jgi:hypothetical protein
MEKNSDLEKLNENWTNLTASQKALIYLKGIFYYEISGNPPRVFKHRVTFSILVGLVAFCIALFFLLKHFSTSMAIILAIGVYNIFCYISLAFIWPPRIKKYFFSWL